MDRALNFRTWLYRSIYMLFFICFYVAVANPCLENNGGCSDICSVMSGGRVCSCNPGFSLDFDGVTCVGTEFYLSSSPFLHQLFFSCYLQHLADVKLLRALYECLVPTLFSFVVLGTIIVNNNNNLYWVGRIQDFREGGSRFECRRRSPIGSV